MKLNSGRLWLKIAVFFLFAPAALWLLVAGVVYWNFDTERLRQTIESSLHAQHRTVHIKGNITPNLWPNKLGVIFHDVHISHPQRTDTFATLERLDIGLSVWDFVFEQQFIVNRIVANTVSAQISRNENGELSIADLLQPHPSSGVTIRLKTLFLQDLALTFTDQQWQKTVQFEHTNLKITHLDQRAHATLESIVRNHDKAFNVQLETPLRIERHPKNHRVSIEKLKLQLNGDLFGLNGARLEATGRAQLYLDSNRIDAQKLQLEFIAPEPATQFRAQFPALTLLANSLEAPQAIIDGSLALTGSRYNFSGNVHTLAFSRNQGRASRVEGQLQWIFGKQRLDTQIDTPLHFNTLTDIHLAPLRLSAQLTSPQLPRQEMRSTLIGDMQIDLNQHTLSTNLEGTLDGEKLRIKGQQQGFSAPKHTIALALARLDLNRYLPRTQQKNQNTALLNSRQPLGLDWIAPLDIEGDVEIGELSVGRFAMHNLEFHVSARPDRLAFDTFLADIYEGQLSGGFSMTGGEQPRIEIDQRLNHMNLHPLLKDVFNFNRLEGMGNGRIQMNATGKTFDDMRRTLHGTLALNVNKGALTGIDLVSAFRNLPAEIQGWTQKPLRNDTEQKTAFQNLNASFQFADGIARNQDLRLNSSILNLSGSGKLDFVQNIIDYTLEAHVNPAAIASVNRLSVPLKITGALAAPTYALDFNRLVREKKTNDEKQEALKAQITQPLKALVPLN